MKKEDNTSPLEIEYSYKKQPVYDFFKRFCDIIVSLFSLILLSPVFLILMILVKATSEGPIFFKHRRVGKGGVDFYVYKFRTMKYDSRSIAETLTKEEFEEYLVDLKLKDDPRVTKFGRLLRKSSLDELPQLLNILKGDMSLIGPRPILREYELERFGKYQDLLLKVRPGLTGYWGTHGRNDTTYEERIKMELYYITKRSFWMDTKIFFLTFKAIFTKKGAI